MSQTNPQTEQARRVAIANKIAKLLALANSPNESEAMQALEMAQRLKLMHQVTDAELAALDPAQAQDITTSIVDEMKRKQTWRGAIAYGLAELNFCQMYWSGGGTIIRILGTPGSIATAKGFYDYLIATVLRLAEAGVEREKTLYKTYLRQLAGTGIEPTPPQKWSSWKEKFIQGCANRIAARLGQMKRELQRDGITVAAPSPPSTPETPRDRLQPAFAPLTPLPSHDDAETTALMLPVTALAIRSAYQQSAKAISRYRQESGIQLTSGRASSYKVTSAYRAGQAAGNGVSLNRQVSGSGNRRSLPS